MRIYLWVIRIFAVVVIAYCLVAIPVNIWRGTWKSALIAFAIAGISGQYWLYFEDRLGKNDTPDS